MDLEFFHGGITLIFGKLRVGRIVDYLHMIEFLRSKVVIVAGVYPDLYIALVLGIVEFDTSLVIGV